MDKVIISSVSYDQEEILQNIINLYCPQAFDLDPTYSKGMFYKSGRIPTPPLRFDINPTIEGVTPADCQDLPLPDSCVGSMIFDPPFVAGGLSPIKKSSIIMSRFGGFGYIDKHLYPFYKASLHEFARILKDKGVLVVKCQDTVSCSKQWLSHVEIIKYAEDEGFEPIDIFILVAKNRLIDPRWKKQEHSRKFHCYFLVFKAHKIDEV